MEPARGSSVPGLHPLPAGTGTAQRALPCSFQPINPRAAPETHVPAPAQAEILKMYMPEPGAV